MTTTYSPMSADRRYALFLTMVHVGAAATILLAATLAFDLPSFVDGLPQGMLLIAFGMILHRRLRDDYVQSLWQAGVASAFVAVVACFLIAPLVVGFASEASGSDLAWREFRIVVQWPAVVALLGFYGGFYWRMFAGRAAA